MAPTPLPALAIPLPPLPAILMPPPTLSSSSIVKSRIAFMISSPLVQLNAFQVAHLRALHHRVTIHFASVTHITFSLFSVLFDESRRSCPNESPEKCTTAQPT